MKGAGCSSVWYNFTRLYNLTLSCSRLPLTPLSPHPPHRCTAVTGTYHTLTSVVLPVTVRTCYVGEITTAENDLCKFCPGDYYRCGGGRWGSTGSRGCGTDRPRATCASTDQVIITGV